MRILMQILALRRQRPDLDADVNFRGTSGAARNMADREAS